MARVRVGSWQRVSLKHQYILILINTRGNNMIAFFRISNVSGSNLGGSSAAKVLFHLPRILSYVVRDSSSVDKLLEHVNLPTGCGPLLLGNEIAA